MALYPLDQQQDIDQPEMTPSEDTSRVSRRTLMRRSVLGVAGIGLATLLTACDDEDDDLDEEVRVQDDQSI